MNPKTEILINSIFKKLKNFKSKEIILDKKSLQQFIDSLLKEN